jgi:hypothetical protein
MFKPSERFTIVESNPAITTVRQAALKILCSREKSSELPIILPIKEVLFKLKLYQI